MQTNQNQGNTCKAKGVGLHTSIVLSLLCGGVLIGSGCSTSKLGRDLELVCMPIVKKSRSVNNVESGRPLDTTDNRTESDRIYSDLSRANHLDEDNSNVNGFRGRRRLRAPKDHTKRSRMRQCLSCFGEFIQIFFS